VNLYDSDPLLLNALLKTHVMFDSVGAEDIAVPDVPPEFATVGVVPFVPPSAVL
jgi:hypothetical protein